MKKAESHVLAIHKCDVTSHVSAAVTVPLDELISAEDWSTAHEDTDSYLGPANGQTIQQRGGE